DIGDGTTIAAVKLGQKVLAANLPGYVQLAGGTNSYTVAKLKAMGLLKEAREQGAGSKGENFSPLPPAPCPSASIAGIAYGSYARVLLSPILEQLENKEASNTDVKATVRLEENEVLLWQAVELAHSLVSQIKSQ
ncbi:MAG: Light dependent period protein LdpA domain-containing protein, partial [Nostoc sp.]